LFTMLPGYQKGLLHDSGSLFHLLGKHQSMGSEKKPQ